jgi:hypothetical protein
VVARSPGHGLQPLWSTEAHQQGHNREKGTQGTWLGPHRGSGGGVATEGRWGNDGGEKLSNNGAQASEEGESEMGEVR